MIRLALRNPYLVIVVALAIVLLGAVSVGRVPADLLPQFETSAVQIVTFYPGMPPEVMEKDIMSRLQRWTGQSVGIEHQEAKAMQGVCIVKDFFHDDISMDSAISQVTSYAMSDMFYLPPGTIPPMVMPFDPTASVPLCLVVVSNEQMDEQQLYDIAYYELRNKLQAIQGVVAPAVYGGKLRRILAYVDREKLEAHGLSLMDVQRALRRENVLIPAGNIKIGENDLQIFTNAIPEYVEELNNTPLKVVDGVPVLISDVGRVENTSQIQSNVVRINGNRRAYIPIYRQPGANTLEIVKQINEQLESILLKLKTERSEDPRMDTLVLTVAMDQSTGVRKSINDLLWAGGLGMILAALVVFVFLRNLRTTIVVLLCIPLAIMTSILAMYFTGSTFNAMTLGGLALAIGILVDQSIVVLENVVRHAQMGKPPHQAALEGTQEVAMPVLVSTITFGVVFLPVVFLSGLAKFLFEPLALAATVAIASSYILAITLVPAYCAKFLKVKTSEKSNSKGSGNAFTGRYLGVLSLFIKMRYAITLGMVALCAFAVFGLTQMGQELFPQVDSGQFTMYVRMPTGTNIDKTEEVIVEIEEVVQEMIGKPDPLFEDSNSNLQLIISNIGVLMDWPAAYTPNTGPMDGFMLVQLKPGQGPDVFQHVKNLREQLKIQFPDVEIAFDTGGMLTAALNMGEPSPIHFQVEGPNLETAIQLAGLIQEEAAQVPGTADVRIAQRIDYPSLEVIFNRDMAARLGLSTKEMAENLVSATNSSINFDPAFWVDKNKGNHYFLGVQYREDDLDSVETLLNIPVGSGPDGSPIRLRTIATIREATSPAVINHRNITRVVDIYANVQTGFDVGGLVRDIEKRLEAVGAVAQSDERGALYKVGPIESETNPGKPVNEGSALGDKEYKGFSFRMMGEVRSMREIFWQFGLGLLIATTLVYLVMVAQFRSFTDPFIVLLVVPLGFIGVVAALYVTNTHLSIMSFMGIIMMIGIVVEYSIVLVDFANHRVNEGLSPRDAVLDAARVRMRPILMTSLTTWLALLPMAIVAGANAPLARAIIGGVIGATVLTLLVVPCLYVILKRVPDHLPRHEAA